MAAVRAVLWGLHLLAVVIATAWFCVHGFGQSRSALQDCAVACEALMTLAACFAVTFSLDKMMGKDE